MLPHIPASKRILQMSNTKNDEEVFFPKAVSGKHPYAREVIKRAEAMGFGIGEIARIIGKSQPYVSQVKAGQGNFKVEDLQPLVLKLFPKVPGSDFHTYTVLKEIKPLFPEHWEEQVLIEGLHSVSEVLPGGRYPSGDDSYEDVERIHNKCLDKVDSDGKAIDSYLTYCGLCEHSLSRIDAITKLTEALAQFKVEKDSKKENLDEMARWGDNFIHHILAHPKAGEVSEELISKIEDRLSLLVNIRFPNQWDDYYKSNLISACDQALNSVLRQSPLVSRQGVHYDWNEFSELKKEDIGMITNPEAHAERILEKCQDLQKMLNEARREKQEKFRLTRHYSQKVLDALQDVPFTSPFEKENIKQWGEKLFGNKEVMVYRGSENYYPINLTVAFSLWVDKIEFTYLEETVQVCGSRLLHESFGEQQIAVHELHSQQFVVLHTFEEKSDKKELTMLSDRLTVEKLFEHLRSLASMHSWDMDQFHVIRDALQKSLLTKGYRVPGVSSIY